MFKRPLKGRVTLLILQMTLNGQSIINTGNDLMHKGLFWETFIKPSVEILWSGESVFMIYLFCRTKDEGTTMEVVLHILKHVC